MQAAHVSVYETIVGENDDVAVTADHPSLRDWPDWPKAAILACFDDQDGGLVLTSPNPFHGAVKFVDFPIDAAEAILQRGVFVLARFNEDGKIEAHECHLTGTCKDTLS